MKENFLDTPAGKAWISFQISPTADRGSDLINALLLDKARSKQNQKPEIEM